MKDSFIYPQYITWKVDILGKQNALSCFQEKVAKKILKSQTRLKDAGYEFVVETVDLTYMKKFKPLYVSNIGQKDNPKVFEVEEEIKNKLSAGAQIEAISLYKKDDYLGGSIYNIYPDKFSVIYRTFIKDLEITLPVNAGVVADYLIYQKGIDTKKSFFIHGRDRNLYGLHSDIGLTQYKLMVGAVPYVSLHENQIFFSRQKNDFSGTNIQIIEGATSPIIEQDFSKSQGAVLVFLGSEKDTPIKKALLFVKNKDEELLKKCDHLFKNPNFSTEVVEIN